jgi:signal transduction histidine kinase/DNA-binding response OmpR family regulator
MWFATEGGGLLFYNPKTTEQKLYPIGSLSAGNREMNVFKTLVIDEDIIYCGTHLGAVYKFYISQQRYELLHNFDRYGIHSLLLDSKRRLWIPTSGRDRLMIFENDKMDTVFYLDSNGEKQTFPAIRTLLELNNNVFILGTSNGGIYLYDKNKLTVEHIHTRIPLGGQEQIGVISSIVKDSSYIYISTTRMGLFRFDHNLQLINQYSYENGITDSFISSLVIDKNNNLWAATGNDIFRLNRDDGRFYSISPTGSFFQELTVHAASVSSDGTLYFPGNRGVASFNPKNLINNPIIPPIFITSLISNNEDIRCRIKDNGNTKKRYSITLNPNENNLTIRYTALNFVHSSGNRYMIKMENIDEVWHNVGDRREAYYSNLRPGHYTFRLRASNNDGVWNPEETTLSVYVESPFYQTNWAYAIYLFLLLSVIFFIERYQRNRLKLKSEIRIKQIEQDNLKELHDERMRMYANFSHELKTPLTLIMNPLQELVRKPSFSQEVRDSLQKMRKNTNKMLELVNKLMDIQKYEAGKSILNKKSFNFYSFIEEIYESFQQTAQNRQINFLIINKLHIPFYIVCFDKTEIEKVFLNLLSNAFKFTPSGGTVTITVQSIQENGNQYLSVEITDTGQGFSEEESKVIFEPFYQLGNDLHKQISGTGIGLSLVRSIVAQHNGLIKVNSQEQVGSTFAILLPDTEKQPANYSLSEKQQEAHSLMEQQDKTTKKTILLVDNEIDILDYLEEKLSPSYFILRAENGKKALSIIEQKIPDLLISDIVMPEMNGIALCDYLKKTSKYSHIPIILLTGKSDENQKMEGFDAGADTYITKPFSIDFLKVRIKNLVESREKIKSVYNDNHLPEVLGIDKAQYKNEFVIKYIEFLKANISNQALSVTDICEGLGMSRANFYRKVKEVTQLSPTDLIKLVRLDASVKLLVKSDKNVSEIAQIVGFSNRSFFSRIFKSEYGVSPSEYQKKYKGVNE